MTYLTKIAYLAAPVAMLGAYAAAAAPAATAEEKARCEAVLTKETGGQHDHGSAKGTGTTAATTSKHQMGTKTQHSHAEQKGTIAQTAMNKEHARCAKILGKK